jgi:hypothetical protein
MVTRPAYVWSGSDWDEIGDARLGTSVTAINSELSALDTALGSKLDVAGGKILQIVRATDTLSRNTTSATFVDLTGMSVTITPQKSDSAILILLSVRSTQTRGAAGDCTGFLQITDNSNNPISGGEELIIGSNTTIRNRGAGFILARATPATTSAVTFKARFRSESAATTHGVDGNVQTSQIYAIEVSA